jgi:hypothetical protein
MSTYKVLLSSLSIRAAAIACLALPLLFCGCSKPDQPIQGSTKSEAPKAVDGIMQHSEEKNDK